MKQEQADLEHQLWEERRAIQTKHEAKVKVAITKSVVSARITSAAGVHLFAGLR